MKEFFLKNAKHDNLPYIIAEMNSSHNGNIDKAKEMILTAKSVGCSAVKFQSWTSDSLYSKNYYNDNPIAKRMVDRFSLSPEALLELAVFSRENNIDFSSTPYCRDEVDFLVDECQADFIKIASMDLNNLKYLSYVGNKQLPVILSTGMGSEEEIDRAVNVILETGNTRLCLLHCVSVYPVDIKDAGLKQVSRLKDKYPDLWIGYSDHTLGNSAAIAATALGAAVIEKHFTLDKSKIGWDNQMATEPEQFKDLVRECKSIANAIGLNEKNISEDEQKQKLLMRRSIVAARNIQAGCVLTDVDLDAKRPGTGIPVDKWEDVVGKVLTRNVQKDEMIFVDDLV